MAIHKAYPGLKVEIVVNDKALPEHEDPDLESAPNEVITYVEAEAGAEFAIRIHYDKTFRRTQDVAEEVWVDGQVIQKWCSKKTCLGENLTRDICGAEREIAGQATEQTLCFGELKITDDVARGSAKSLLRKAEQLGEIRLEFAFGTSGAATTAKAAWKQQEFVGVAEMPEKALKGDAKSLQISLGAKRPVATSTMFIWEEDGKGPFAVFKFRYRSRANLQALGIIPRDPSPTPTPELDQPAPPQQNNPASEVSDGLSKPEMIMLISHYRGHANGLEGQSTTHLQLLLKFYDGQAQGSAGSRVKREHDDDVRVTGERKRRRTETIVLDD